MKTPLEGTIAFNEIKREDLLKLREKRQRYHILTHDPPIKQNGQRFGFLVVPLEITDDWRLIQAGQGILCQTKDEAGETIAGLSEIKKRHLGIFQAAGLGGVAWVTNVRRLTRELSARCKTLPNGRKLWIALERDIDRDTNEITVIRQQKVTNQQEAERLAKQWQSEYDQEKKKAEAAVGTNVTPPAPPRTAPLTQHDREDLAKAKMTALKRQWPHSFEIFEKRKANPKPALTDQEIEEAYLLDLAEQGTDPGTWTATIRADMQLISALHKAAVNFRRRGKSKITDLAVYLIAFNWELGWCYLSDNEIAATISNMAGVPFKAKQIKDLRVRVLGLVAKHQPGPPPKSA